MQFTAGDRVTVRGEPLGRRRSDGVCRLRRCSSLSAPSPSTPAEAAGSCFPSIAPSSLQHAANSRGHAAPLDARPARAACRNSAFRPAAVGAPRRHRHSSRFSSNRRSRSSRARVALPAGRRSRPRQDDPGRADAGRAAAARLVRARAHPHALGPAPAVGRRAAARGSHIRAAVIDAAARLDACRARCRSM